MTPMRKAGWLVLALWSLTAADGPAAYIVKVPVVPRAGSTVQRIDLPAAVLAASRSAGLADVRVFDSAGRSMPIARAAAAVAPGGRYELPALPILGAADTVTVTGVSLQLDGGGATRSARIDGTVAGEPGAKLVGVLFDARAISAAANRLTIDADLPVAQPVTLMVEASSDLKSWRPIAETAVYRAAGDTAQPVLRLGGAMLDRDYLRVGWRAASRLLTPVLIRRATLITGGAAPSAVTMSATLPELQDAHAIEVAVPFATPVATLRVVTAGDDVIVPVRVFGRRDREQPWELIGTGTAGRGAAESLDIVLRDGGYPTIRIEADERSAGFTAAPTLRIGFAPRAIMFIAAGRPPFTLAVGRAGTSDAYLPLDSVMTQAGGKPVATASVEAPRDEMRLSAPDDAGGSRRQIILWAVLIAATAVLAGMAAMLWRRQAAS